LSLPLLLLDDHARVRCANPAAAALFGGGGSALDGGPLVDLLDEDVAAVEEALAAARAAGHGEAGGWRVRGGGSGLVAARVRVGMDALAFDDGARGFALVAREDDGRAEAEAQLRAALAREEEARERAEEASRARDEFLATLS